MENKKVYVLMQQRNCESFRLIGVFSSRDEAYNEMCNMMDKYDYEQVKFDCEEPTDFIESYDYFMSNDEFSSWVCGFEIYEEEFKESD